MTRDRTMEALSRGPVRCAGCRGRSFSANSEGIPICDYCGAAYADPDPRCPACGSVHDSDTHRCTSCETPLARECPICGTRNPLTASKCLVCGQTLEVTDALFGRLSRGTADRLRRVRELGADIKSIEEKASRSRLSRMWADEYRRREALERAEAGRERQERIILIVATVLVAVAVVMATVIAVIGPGGAPFPGIPG